MGYAVFRIAPVLLALTGLAQAQTPSTAGGSDDDLKQLPQRFLTDEWTLWTSPFRASSYNSPGFNTFLISSVVITGALVANDRKITGALPNTADQLKWSGRVSQIGSAYSLSGITAGTYVLGRLIHNNHLRETGLLALEALGHTQIVVFGLKEAANRERPLDHDRHGEFWEGGNSFPSGHTASAFAVASVFAFEYHDHIAVPIAAYSLASLVAFSRLSADQHWMSDIVAGGSLGVLVGRFMYKRRHGAIPATGWRSPHIAFTGQGALVRWVF